MPSSSYLRFLPTLLSIWKSGIFSIGTLGASGITCSTGAAFFGILFELFGIVSELFPEFFGIVWRGCGASGCCTTSECTIVTGCTCRSGYSCTGGKPHIGGSGTSVRGSIGCSRCGGGVIPCASGAGRSPGYSYGGMSRSFIGSWFGSLPIGSDVRPSSSEPT